MFKTFNKRRNSLKVGLNASECGNKMWNLNALKVWGNCFAELKYL